MPSTESIKVGFTYPTLTKLIGQPTFHTLDLMERELSKIVTTPKNSLSPIGYTALIMLPLMYLQYVPALFPFPPNPGALPAHALGTSAHEMANVTNAWR